MPASLACSRAPSEVQCGVSGKKLAERQQNCQLLVHFDRTGEGLELDLT